VNIEVLKHALTEGVMIPFQYLKCFLVGIPQIGKTAVRRRLSGSLKLNISSLPGGKADWESTPMAECSFVSVTQNIVAVTDPDWREVAGKDELEGIMSLINQYSETGTTESDAGVSDTVGNDGDTSSAEYGDDTPYTKMDSNIPEEVIKKFNIELAKSGNKSEFEKVILMLLMIDVGGQAEFLELLPLLMNGPAIYLAFFNLSKASLDDPYVEKSTYDTTIKDSTLSLGDVIIQILSNVAFSEHPKEDVKKALDVMIEIVEGKKKGLSVEKIHSAVALLVGTYKDELKREIEVRARTRDDFDLKVELQCELNRISKCLEAKLEEVFDSEENMDHVVFASDDPKRLMFDIDNMYGDVAEIENLRNRLMKEIRRFTDIRIPLRWLVFGVVLRTEYEFITVKDCKRVAQALRISADIKNVLWFLSSVTGMLLYQPGMPEGDLKEVILCNPQVLFNSIAQIIIQAKSWKTGAKASFHNKGKFCLSNLDFQSPIKDLKTSLRRRKPTDSAEKCNQTVLPLHQLIHLLLYRKVVARCSNQDDVYIMPALLGSLSEEERKRAMVRKENTSLPCSLFIQFGDFSYAPLGFFSCIIAELIGSKDVKVCEGLRKNCICLTGLETPPLFEVAIFAHSKRYEVLVKACQSDEKRKMCRCMIELLIKVMDSVIKDLNFSVDRPKFMLQLCHFQVNTEQKQDPIYCIKCCQDIKLDDETQLVWMVSLQGRITCSCRMCKLACTNVSTSTGCVTITLCMFLFSTVSAYIQHRD
jgi:hypothetical protein